MGKLMHPRIADTRSYSTLGQALLTGLMFIFLSGCQGSQQPDETAGPSDSELSVGMPGEDNSIPTEESLQPPAVDVDPSTAAHVKLTEEPGGEIAEPPSWREWSNPQFVLVISGQQHGYIEPCGCTGLANQKGGLMRRATFLEQVRAQGWDVLPLDAGNQVRRTGRQPAIKFQTAVKGLQEMQYQAIGFGPDDLRLGASELLSVAADDGESKNPFVTANVELLAPELVPLYQTHVVGDQTIGITSITDPETIEGPLDDGIVVGDPIEKARAAVEAMDGEGCDFKVVLFFGTGERAEELVKAVPGFQLVVAGQTYGEPHYQADLVEGTETRLVKTGDKGMFVGLVGLFEGGEIKYSRVPLDDSYEDARSMLDLMASYQEQLKALGLDGLQIKPLPHESGGEFVGAARCGECHTTAYEIWQGSPHAEATEDIVHPGERSEIPRHFDPECLSCHVTGWKPQGKYPDTFGPYTSGYLSLESTPLMTGSGCENCHGPGKAHAEAEDGGDFSEEEIQRLRESVRLTLDNAREKCIECHDYDNSPDFHKEGAFEEYWSRIEHYGVD